jgi:hypothetical protein
MQRRSGFRLNPTFSIRRNPPERRINPLLQQGPHFHHHWNSSSTRLLIQLKCFDGELMERKTLLPPRSSGLPQILMRTYLTHFRVWVAPPDIAGNRAVLPESDVGAIAYHKYLRDAGAPFRYSNASVESLP